MLEKPRIIFKKAKMALLGEKPGDRMDVLMDEALSNRKIVESLKECRIAPLTKFFLSKMKRSPISISDPYIYGRLISSMVLHRGLGLRTNSLFSQKGKEELILTTATTALITAIRLKRASQGEPYHNPLINYIDDLMKAFVIGSKSEIGHIRKIKYGRIDWSNWFSREQWTSLTTPDQDLLNSIGDRNLLTPRAHKALVELGLKPTHSFVRHHVGYGEAFSNLSIPPEKK